MALLDTVLVGPALVGLALVDLVLGAMVLGPVAGEMVSVAQDELAEFIQEVSEETESPDMRAL